MTYETLPPKKVIRIKCTVKEYGSKNFKDYFNCALRSIPDKIVIEIIKDE